MVYYNSEMMKFPKHFGVIDTNLTITITNELTDEVVTLDVEDSGNDRYYEFNIDVNLKNGIYKYQIGKEVGLMQVGDFVADVKEYNEKKTNVTYER